MFDLLKRVLMCRVSSPLSIPDVLSRRLGSVNGKHVDQGSGEPVNRNSRRARVLLLKLCTWFVVLV